MTFIIVDEVYTRFVRLLCEDLAIGVPVSQVDTRKDGPCPMEWLRQHFTPSVNTSVYFSKSLALGLPVSRTDTKRDGSFCIQWSQRLSCCHGGFLVRPENALVFFNLLVLY